MSGQTLSKSKFAALIGVSAPRVSQLVRLGLPVDPDGKIDPEAGVAWVAANVKRAATLKDSGEAETEGVEPGGLIAARIKLLTIQIARAEEGLKRDRDQVIEKEIVGRALTEWATRLKISNLNFPSRRGPGIAAELEVNEVALVGLLEAAMRLHMLEFCEERLPSLLADCGNPDPLGAPAR